MADTQIAQQLWDETFFNVQGWAQNLRSLLPFQGKHTVKYGKINMEYSAATSIQITNLGLENALFAITICLDHRMRIWNLEDGQIMYTGDILNADRSPQEIGKWSIDPSQSNLIQLTRTNRGQCICATFSPVGIGEFKFWRIVAKDTHTIIVDDMFPKDTLIPHTPSSDVWTLADFVLASPGDGATNLWTLWKNNLTYRVQRLELDRKNMTQSWEDAWDAVFADTEMATADTSGSCDAMDVTEKWLEFIMQPGRFTRATLETALSIYERGLGAPKEGNQNRGLAESICAVLGSSASLERSSSGAMDYDQYRSASDAQWRRFHRLLNDLDNERGEAIGLALDPEADMIWVVCSDVLAAVRECSDVERLYHSLDNPEQGRERHAALISSALSLVDGLSANLLQLSQAALRPELFEESEKPSLQRLEAFENKAGFWRGVTKEDCDHIYSVLGDGYAKVTDELYGDLNDLLSVPPSARNRTDRYPLSEFGRKLVMQGAQENIELRWNICFAQVVLLAHMEFEFDEDEEQLHSRVDVGAVFSQFVESLRRLEWLRWLARTELSMPLTKPDRRASLPPKKGEEIVQTCTAFEIHVDHLLGLANVTAEPLAVSLTDIISNLCAADSDILLLPAMVQCSLLKRKRADLAADLIPFCDDSAFSLYIQGRVHLDLNDFASASLCFREAAEGMSETSPINIGKIRTDHCLGAQNKQIERHSSGLLDTTEWNMLNSGRSKYYAHIVALYEEHNAYSHVVEFAELAIEHINEKRDQLSAKTEILSRLFNAAVATSHFELAHRSLQSFKDDALRHSCLRKLVDRMCESCHNKELVNLSFPGMQQAVDDFLAQRCTSIVDVTHGPPYHQLLYSWRTKHGNYRGAASVLFDRIQKLRLAGEGDNIAGDDSLDTPVTRQYLLLINALTCVEPKQAWIYDEANYGSKDPDQKARRKLVTLADVRKQYQDELDRIAAIQNNQFGFEADDVMEIA